MAIGLEIGLVDAGSIAASLQIQPGDRVIGVNGKPIRDLIDFSFACADEQLSIRVVKKNGVRVDLSVVKKMEDNLGITFCQATSDEIRRCHNRCVFCFVDQMPPGLRPSLYVKDDDWRLSILQGNFITLTNFTSDDMERLTSYHLSPLYISIHTTNGSLRKSMMGNPKASTIMDQLTTLAGAGIEMHCQIVVCPGLNDGAELENSVNQLASLYPSVSSIALVPVGLTKFRYHLVPLTPFDKESASRLLGWATGKQQLFRQRFGETFLYLADEFYVMAEQKIPATRLYDGFPQLENGVGLIRQFLDNLATLPKRCRSIRDKKVMFVTGKAAATTIKSLALWCERVAGCETHLLQVENRFWGPMVTAAGLLTATDVLFALNRSKVSCDHVFLPAAMFSRDEMTLDNWTLSDMESAAGIKLQTAASPEEVLTSMLERGE